MPYEYPKEIHFIDTSVLASIIKSDAEEALAEKYLSRVRNGVYKVFISELVLGELLFMIHRDLRDFNKRYDAISKLLIFQGTCSIFVPKLEDYLDVLANLRNMEPRCSSTDVRIISESIISGAQKLITLDTKYNTEDMKGQIEVVNLRNLF